MRIVIFEDSKYINFFPISRLRTVAEIRTGRYTQKERAELQFNNPVLIYSDREDFGDEIERNEDTIFINARAMNFKSFKEIEKGECIINKYGDIIAYRAEKILPETSIKDELNLTERDLPVYGYVWDIIANFKEMLIEDLDNAKELGEVLSPIADSVALENQDKIHIGKKVTIESGVVLDAYHGPIYIEDNSHIRANTVIDGPAFIGESCLVKPGTLLDTVSFGKVSKLSGEIEETIFQGYSNKQHFGFLGHSIIGEWVNIGAGTTNSDLKNNYSPVRVNHLGNEYETGIQFLGLMMGDHCKTAINISFNTGSIIEPFCNIFGHNFPPKYLPPFTWWGGDFSEYKLDKAIDTAKKVMKRREVELTSHYERMVRKMFEDTRSLREKRQ